VAFSVDGGATEKLIIIAETAASDTADLAGAVADRVRSAFGLPVDKVVLVARGSIPKTSSGKLQRRKTKAMFEDGLLGRLNEPSCSTPAEGLLIG
jgi:acyl-coenzyme A synthetase/AMP-(fatty) acid ligase